MKKRLILLILSLVLMSSLCLLAACGEPEVVEPVETYPNDGNGAAVGTSDITAAETLPETQPETETEADTEADTAPYFDPDSLGLETYQGMTPDIPYTLSYSSNGDGTCTVIGITVNILYEGSYTVEIPETSPDGNTVVGFYCAPTYNIPRYMTAEGFEQMTAWVETYYQKCVSQGIFEGDFYYKSYMSYFSLKDPALSSTPALREDMLAQFPLCEYMPVYVFDYTATNIEFVNITQAMTAAAPWYTAEWCYAELMAVKEWADSVGVTDPYLERCLAEHSDSLGDCVTVKLPKTVTKIETWDPKILSAMGISSMTFDGTVEEFRAISDVENSAVCDPLTVHCSDGDLSYPLTEKRYPILEE